MSKYIEELGDFQGSLKEMRYIVNELINKFGENSIINFDAGYNNITAEITKIVKDGTEV
jgi:hypothetical protein